MMPNWKPTLSRAQRDFLDGALERLAQMEFACRDGVKAVDKNDPLLGTKLLGCVVGASNMRVELETHFGLLTEPGIDPDDVCECEHHADDHDDDGRGGVGACEKRTRGGICSCPVFKTADA